MHELFYLMCYFNVSSFYIKYRDTDVDVYAFKHFNGLKGIVHPKMKILSSFTHPLSKPVRISLFCRTQRKIF